MRKAEQKPQRRTQEERRQESEREIIRAAIRIFSQQGYVKTTMSQVGEAAGYTGGLVSHRFGSKEGLLQAVVKHIASRFLDDQLGDNIQLESAEESLRNYVAIYVGEAAVREGRMKALYSIMGEALGAVPEIQPQLEELSRKARKRLADIVQAGIKNGEFRKDVDPNESAVLILGLLRGVVMQYLSSHRAVNLKKIIPRLQDSVISGLKH